MEPNDLHVVSPPEESRRGLHHFPNRVQANPVIVFQRDPHMGYRGIGCREIDQDLVVPDAWTQIRRHCKIRPQLRSDRTVSGIFDRVRCFHVVGLPDLGDNPSAHPSACAGNDGPYPPLLLQPLNPLSLLQGSLRSINHSRIFGNCGHCKGNKLVFRFPTESAGPEPRIAAACDTRTERNISLKAAPFSIQIFPWRTKYVSGCTFK